MLCLLKEKIHTAKRAGQDVSAQSAALERAMQMVTDVTPPPYQQYPGQQRRYSVDPKVYRQAVQSVRDALDSLAE